MVSSFTKRPRLGLALGVMAIAVSVLGAAPPVKAYGWHGGWYGPRIGIGFGFYPWGYAYPPPVYYAPPPAYYAPAYYFPPPAAAAPAAVYRSTTVHHRVHHVVHHSTANCPTP